MLTPEIADAGPRRISANSYVIAARAVRDFGDGFVAILLPVYLTALGHSPAEIGLVATAALLGSSLLTIAIGLIGARQDHRRLLIAASGLMVATGLAFASANAFTVLLLIAFAGTANPSAGNVSIFVPLEHTVLTRQVRDRDRTRLFARYSLVGAMAAAVGSLATALPDLMVGPGLDRTAALKAMFVLYGCLGVIGGLLYARIPPVPPPPKDRPRSALGPSRGIVYKLTALFSLDAFSSGFVVPSLMALWLFERFDMSLTTAGVFFFWTSVATAFSFPVAAWISRRIGLVNTMVFTHIPASLCLVAAAFAPSLGIALALLIVRAFLNQMDVPTRSSYVMAVVTEAERPAAAGFTSVPRGLATAGAPAITGAFFAAAIYTWPFVLAAGLKISYDLLLLALFRKIKPPEEQIGR
jgi:MFS family permease